MKFPPKYSVALLLTLAFVYAGSINADDYKVVFHLFNPIPQGGAQKRIAALSEKGIKEGIKEFLHAEAKAAFEQVAKEQGKTVDADLYATKLLEEKLEKPYRAKYGKDIYSENLLALPEHIFTYFVNPYLYKVLRRVELPETTRDLSLVTILGYLHMIRVGLNYAQQGIDITNKILDQVGVSK
jgi:hypothetical protein